ncbi:beta-N-acetylhexosaminidase [Paenibacillus sp. J5C_2022]|uniref:beta-N-acetylhexosaminidase n=1 Tax=Paenibacillus sp. J5C2022 TaxID=2977129 RepID=UPI0021D0364F|nr:beta-N-acetylhexosaminidase [Paenibacillus sp. J5C2022]MCU6712724.1 beta-N-acetylhexosaminidase [Paenibacillus sp. J5C2022]
MEKYPFIPVAKSIQEKKGQTSLRNAHIVAVDAELKPIIPILEEEFALLIGSGLERQDEEIVKIELIIDGTLREEQMKLTIGRHIVVQGGSYSAVAGGTVLLLQLATDAGEVPNCIIEDEPDLPYRGLMLDLARHWHSIDCVKKAIELCRFYRLSHLQLHLSDDQSFTFPLTCFPNIATPGRHYTRQLLDELVEFAHQRGIELVPEIDLPGHSEILNRSEPELFTSGIGGEHENAICLGNAAVYEAVEQIMSELCEVFKYSRHIHLGCDETKMSIFEQCPTCRERMKELEVTSAEGLLRSFIVRAAEMVERNGRKPIVWEGFSPEPGIEIPKDITVVAWESYYHSADELAAAGYPLINASWQPLYVTPNAGWSPEHIYGWNVRRWEHWWEKSKAHLSPIQLDKSANVIGAQFCSWENEEENVLDLLRLRVPTMVERIWNEERKIRWEQFSERLDRLDIKAMRLVEGIIRD